MGPGLLTLLVSPDCNEPGSLNIVDQTTRIKRLLKHGSGIKVAFTLPHQVFRVSQQVTFVVVAARMGKNKIMAQINRVSRPGYETIRMACATNRFAAFTGHISYRIQGKKPIAL